MADATATLIVKLEAQMDQFTKAIAKLNGDVVTAHRTVESNFAKIQESAKGLGKGLLLALGGGVLFAGLEELPRIAREAIDKVAAIGTEAKKLGISNEFLQQLQLIGKEADVSNEALNNGLETFSKNIGLAKTGAGELLPILKANNIALTDASGNQRPLNDLIRDYANLIRNAKSPQDAALLATRAFGKEVGEQLIPALRGGAQAIDDMNAAAAARHGGFISDEDIAKAKELKDRFDILSDRFDTFVQKAAVAGLTFLEKVGEVEHDLVDAGAALLDIVDPTPIEKLKAQIASVELTIRHLQELAAQGIVVNIDADTKALDELQAKLAALTAGDRVSGAFADAAGVGQFSSVDALKSSAKPTVIPPAPKRSGGADPAKQFQSEIDSIHKRTEALKAETATIGQSVEAQERAKIEAQLFASAQDKNVAGAKQFKTVQDLLAASTDSLTPKQAKLREQILSTAGAYAKASAEAADAQQRQDLLNQAQSDFANEAFDGIDRLVVEHEKLNDVMQDSIKWLAEMALKAALLGQGPLASLFGTAQAASAGGSGIGGLLGTIFGGFRADGGDVDEGKAYVVGEKRPEIFVPTSPGRILPSAAGAGGASRVHVSTEVNINPSPLLVASWESRARAAEDRGAARAPALARDQQRRVGRA